MGQSHDVKLSHPLLLDLTCLDDDEFSYATLIFVMCIFTAIGEATQL